MICCVIPNKNRQRYRVRQFLRSLMSVIHVSRRAAHVGKDCACGTSLYINKNTYIKDYVNTGNLRVLGKGNFIIGSYCNLGENLLVITGNHNYEGELLPFDEKWNNKSVEIGEACWLGARVTLLPGTKIGEGAIIQAGAVVHGEIPPYAIAGGNPAKVFKYRDKEHFLKLKSENRYLT